MCTKLWTLGPGWGQKVVPVQLALLDKGAVVLIPPLQLLHFALLEATHILLAIKIPDLWERTLGPYPKKQSRSGYLNYWTETATKPCRRDSRGESAKKSKRHTRCTFLRWVVSSSSSWSSCSSLPGAVRDRGDLAGEGPRLRRPPASSGGGLGSPENTREPPKGPWVCISKINTLWHPVASCSLFECMNYHRVPSMTLVSK